MPQITVEIRRRIIERFKIEAKRAWPREAFAYLIGHNVGDLVVIEDLYIPDDVDCFNNETSVYPQLHWMAEARVQAEDDEMEIVGDIHSHPYTFAQCSGALGETIPSEGDHAEGWDGICGICVVSEQKSGGLKARARFYGPTFKVETKLI